MCKERLLPRLFCSHTFQFCSVISRQLAQGISRVMTIIFIIFESMVNKGIMYGVNTSTVGGNIQTENLRCIVLPLPFSTKSFPRAVL